MTVYYVDDGGSATSPYDTWAKAATSLSALDDAITLGSGDIVYIGHNHVCQFSHSANRTITGPTNSPPCIIISATQGSDPPTYAASTTNQIDTTEGAYSLSFDGAFALYGICMIAGARSQLGPDSNESCYAYGCTFKLAANSDLYAGATQDRTELINCTIDCAADGTSARTNPCIVSPGNNLLIKNVTFSNVAYRTGSVFNITGGADIADCDLSGFTNGTSCEIVSAGFGSITNCLTAATWAPFTQTITGNEVLITNTGPADAPTYVAKGSYLGSCISTTSIYRTGGATVEGEACAWLMTTTAQAAEGAQFYSPYIYGTVASTGSKTFDLYITNDTADLTDAEAWLEVEYLSTSDEAIWALATDHRATITTTAQAQTDDTTSTWNGTGPSFTYKQKLSVTADVGETGQFRARVAVGKASIASSAYFYVDPKVTVS